MLAIAWLLGAGGLAVVLLLALQRTARSGLQMTVGVCQVAGPDREHDHGGVADARSAPPATVAEPDRVERHLAWIEERESARTGMQQQVLAAVQEATAALERCSEIAGAHQEVQALLDVSLDRMRYAMRGLRGDLSPLGNAPPGTGASLRQSLENLGELVERASLLTVESRIDAAVDGCLSEVQRTHVLHVAREALANVVRHAGGSRVAFRATVEKRRFVVSISDDGRGFDPRAPRPGSQQGLTKMQFRAEAALGLLQVESARSAGTIVTVTIPLDAAPTPRG